MKKAVSILEVKRAEKQKIEGGESALSLMERAAAALADRVMESMRELNVQEALFVCGGGNNGGDGFAAARLLIEQGMDAKVLCLAKSFSPDCAVMRDRYQGEFFARICRRKFPLIIDCVLGTGISRAPEGEAKAMIEFINSSGAYVIACDLPSGLSENGIALSPCVKANQTLSMGGLKSALLLSDGADVSGEISVAEIGLNFSDSVEVWEDEDVLKFFPPRASHVNKGAFGSACILSDPSEYSGAAFLAAAACLRSGAGYTRLVAGEPLYTQAIGRLPAVVLQRSPSSLQGLMGTDAIAFGMGAGVTEEVYQKVNELLQNDGGALILDADALNALAFYGVEALKRERRCEVIITPHLKEFARLVKREVKEVAANALELAREFAREYHVVVMLKNNRTIITDGKRTAIDLPGSPALAKGGSGDVLSGFLAGTCARGVPLYEAACVSGYLLGRAGEIAAREMGEYSPDAEDIILRLSEAILSLNDQK